MNSNSDKFESYGPEDNSHTPSGETSPKPAFPQPGQSPAPTFDPAHGPVTRSVNSKNSERVEDAMVSAYRSDRRATDPTPTETQASTAVSTGTAVSRAATNRSAKNSSQKTSGGGLGGLFWLLSLMLLMVAAWRVGPYVVQQYHYSAAMGKIKAEYDHAGQVLVNSPLRDVSKAYQLVAQRVRPSVVSVHTTSGSRPGLGSGVIISDEGYIVTNSHVVEDTDSLSVVLYDKRQFRAQLVGMDEHSDLAVIRISNADNLVVAEWGNSDELSVGSMVWAVGSPFEYDQTVTSGIVSGKHRANNDDLAEQNMIQTDAAISPGSSGGPLVDVNGQVVGINTSIYGKTFQGISFAVPSSTAEFVISQLIEYGKVSRGYLGVSPRELNQILAERYGVPDLDGAFLQNVGSDSPAFRSGLRPSDVIRSWNGVPIKEYKTLFSAVEVTPPNSTVDVKIYRQGIEQDVRVTVGTRPPIRRRPRG